MALIKCENCGGKMSDRARKCPHCGKEYVQMNVLHEEKEVSEKIGVNEIPVAKVETDGGDACEEQNVKNPKTEADTVESEIETNITKPINEVVAAEINAKPIEIESIGEQACTEKSNTIEEKNEAQNPEYKAETQSSGTKTEDMVLEDKAKIQSPEPKPVKQAPAPKKDKKVNPLIIGLSAIILVLVIVIVVMAGSKNSKSNEATAEKSSSRVSESSVTEETVEKTETKNNADSTIEIDADDEEEEDTADQDTEERVVSEGAFVVDKVIYDGESVSISCDQITNRGMDFTLTSKLENRTISAMIFAVALDGKNVPLSLESVELEPGKSQEVTLDGDIAKTEHKYMSLKAEFFTDEGNEFDSADLCNVDLGGQENAEADEEGEVAYESDTVKVLKLGPGEDGLDFYFINKTENTICLYMDTFTIDGKTYDYNNMYLDQTYIPAKSAAKVCANLTDYNADIVPKNIKTYEGKMMVYGDAINAGEDETIEVSSDQ